MEPFILPGDLHAHEATLSRPERKARGVFYTPREIVEHVLDQLAFPPAGGHDVRILDLSCGTGGFLVPAAERLARRLREQGVSPSEGARLLDATVHGIDIDAAAVAQAQAFLRSTAQAAGYPATFPHVRVGDVTEGLAAAGINAGEFDYVVGNPPYIEAKKAPRELKARCRRHFPASARGAFDTYVCFLDAGLQALRPGGRLGYVVPNKLMVADYAAPLRECLVRDCTLLEIADVSHALPFERAAVYPITLCLVKSPPPAGHTLHTRPDLAHTRELGTLPSIPLPQSVYAARPRCLFFLPPADAGERRLLERLLAVPRRFGDEAVIQWTVSFHRTGLREQFIFPQATGAHPQRLLGGKAHHGNGDVRRYRITWSGWWIDYDRERARQAGNSLPAPALFAPPKLLIAQNAKRIQAALDTEGWYCKDTFLVARLRDQAPERGEERLRALMALINSRLLSFYYQRVFHGTHVAAGYLHYLAGYLADLPVLLPNAAVPELAELTRQVEVAADAEVFRAADAALDDAVERLFGLSAAEVEIVRRTVGAEKDGGNGRRGRWAAASHCGDG